MLATGTRLGEATGVRWQDMDLADRFVRISGQLQRLDKKLEYRATTKTNQARTLSLPQWLATELQDMKSKQLIDGYLDPEGIAFLNPYGRRFDPKYVGTKLAEACNAAEIPTVNPHALRHTAATLAAQATGDIHAVKNLLGHQQIALTSNLYGHATVLGNRDTSEKLSRSIEPKRSAPN